MFNVCMSHTANWQPIKAVFLVVRYPRFVTELVIPLRHDLFPAYTDNKQLRFAQSNNIIQTNLDNSMTVVSVHCSYLVRLELF